jgi:L-alanine-DL-glutamate epimerase-like enolase superfamily enzyme
MEVSGHLHAPAALPPEKEPWYPFYRMLGGPQSWSVRFYKDKTRFREQDYIALRRKTAWKQFLNLKLSVPDQTEPMINYNVPENTL